MYWLEFEQNLTYFLTKKAHFCTFQPTFQLSTSRFVHFDFWVWNINPDIRSKSGPKTRLETCFYFFPWRFMTFLQILGQAGVDFPVLASVPQTSFDCNAQKFPGIYSDVDADCQVRHKWCHKDEGLFLTTTFWYPRFWCWELHLHSYQGPFWLALMHAH